MSPFLSRPARVGAGVLTVLVLSAWAPIDSSRPVWRMTVPYLMNSAGSADLGAATTETEVNRAMGDWTRVSCTSLTASYGGSVTNRATNGDGRSVISWTESGWPHDSSAIGVTGPAWTTGGGGPTIREADMEMNGVNFRWVTTAGRGGDVNAYSIILHEGGHFYGLGHSSDAGATMYFAYSGGIDMIGTDDQNGICALYPGSGTDCTTTGCPTGQTCNAGVCETVMGDGNTCSPCTSGADCTAGICLGYPDGSGYCGTNCSSGSDCGSGEMCVGITGAPSRQCVRFASGAPTCAGATTGCTSDAGCSATEMCNTATRTCVPRPTTGTVPLGGACSESSECQTGLCFAGACSQTCNWLDPTSCPGGFYCNGQASCGSGVCMAGSAGPAALGAACSTNTECATLYCAAGRCSEPCIPGGAAACEPGYACAVGGAPGCGSCLPELGALGDPCATNADCTSGLCATSGDTTFCTAICDPAASPACPARFLCTSAGPVSVCAPDGGVLGSSCSVDGDCIGGVCAHEGDRSYCTRICTIEPCPVGFGCIDTVDGVTRVCRPRDDGGCGCSAAGVGGRSSLGVMLLGSALAIVLAARRRR